MRGPSRLNKGTRRVRGMLEKCTGRGTDRCKGPEVGMSCGFEGVIMGRVGGALGQWGGGESDFVADVMGDRGHGQIGER
jgi:hypothetical protein